ncbi:MAG: CYTH domain-containing protein [Ktedonobacteraceae bacterium]
MIEVEKTCVLSAESRDRLHEKLRGMTHQGVVQQTDSYYDTPAWDLLRQAVFVRVRNMSTLQIKFDEEGSDKHHVECVERAFSVEGPLPEEAHALLQRFLPYWRPAASFSEAVAVNHLEEFVCLHKTRFIYTDDTLIVALDHVEGLGDFVEVEIQCEEGQDTSQARVILEAFVSTLNAEPLKAGYTELWLRQHQPEVYQCGQYHL